MLEPAANREMLRPHLTREWHRELLTRDGLMVVDGGACRLVESQDAECKLHATRAPVDNRVRHVGFWKQTRAVPNELYNTGLEYKIELRHSSVVKPLH